THKAIDLLTPKPNIQYNYFTYQGKKLYIITTEKSDELITFNGKTYIRKDSRSVVEKPEEKQYKIGDYERIKNVAKRIKSSREIGTSAKSKFLDHYISVMNIANDLSGILYPKDPIIPTENLEGKILTRILFSSCADTFETYLSDLLYEIYLANPNTLKSKQQVSIKEVLDCGDMQDFVDYWAKKKLSKLQRGSVKGFIAENKQISELKAINEAEQEEIERILQIRHLYAHKNGRVDEKFLQYNPGEYKINEEHQLSFAVLLDKLEYLFDIINKIDLAAIQKYKLATVD
ncbi:MAG: helix-turn-helix domain-containing protein, partial [Candidatus Cyclobacteriaceae bacterium M2_1C_046]